MKLKLTGWKLLSNSRQNAKKYFLFWRWSGIKKLFINNSKSKIPLHNITYNLKERSHPNDREYNVNIENTKTNNNNKFQRIDISSPTIQSKGLCIRERVPRLKRTRSDRQCDNIHSELEELRAPLKRKTNQNSSFLTSIEQNNLSELMDICNNDSFNGLDSIYNKKESFKKLDYFSMDIDETSSSE